MSTGARRWSLRLPEQYRDLWPTFDALLRYIDDKLASIAGLTWAAISGKPATFPPDAHTHTTAAITNLSSYTGFDARYYTDSEIDTMLAGYVPTSRTVSSGSGLTGGGDLSANRTLSVDINGLAADATPDGAADYVMTYDASAAVPKKVLLNDLPGGGGGSGGAGYELVAETVLGAAATSIAVTGLDLEAAGRYFIEYTLLGATGSTNTISLYFNGDTADANYDRDLETGGAGTQASNAAIGATIGANSHVGEGFLVEGLDGNPHWHGDGLRWESASSVVRRQGGGLRWLTTTNVTSLTFTGSVTNGLAAGSKVRVLKRVIGAAQEEYKYKTATQSRASTTTPADDDTLFATLAANSKYEFEFNIFTIVEAAPDFRFALNFTGTTTRTNWHGKILDTGAADFTSASVGTAQSVAQEVFGTNLGILDSAQSAFAINIKGTVDVGASGGTLSFQWAQWTSSATAAHVRAGSYMKVRKIA